MPTLKPFVFLTAIFLGISAGGYALALVMSNDGRFIEWVSDLVNLERLLQMEQTNYLAALLILNVVALGACGILALLLTVLVFTAFKPTNRPPKVEQNYPDFEVNQYYDDDGFPYQATAPRHQGAQTSRTNTASLLLEERAEVPQQTQQVLAEQPSVSPSQQASAEQPLTNLPQQMPTDQPQPLIQAPETPRPPTYSTPIVNEGEEPIGAQRASTY